MVMTASDKPLRIETHCLLDDGTVPNNAALPLVIYRGALPDGADRASACEKMFARNGWPDAWRNGIYAHHHYHSTAHEVLGIAAGSARVRVGGEQGQTVELHAGDVVVIPAGVAHKRESASPDLLVIGPTRRGSIRISAGPSPAPAIRRWRTLPRCRCRRIRSPAAPSPCWAAGARLLNPSRPGSSR